MSAQTTLTRQQAEAVLELVKTKFSAYIEAGYEGPILLQDWDWVGVTPWAIIWEGGPYEWAILFGGGGYDHDTMSMIDPTPDPEGVFTEPVTSWALGIYEAS
jgi:hypothetical protein